MTRAELIQSHVALQESTDLSAAVMEDRISVGEMRKRCLLLEEENRSLKELATASAAAERDVQAKLKRELDVTKMSSTEEKKANQDRVLQLQIALDAAKSDIAEKKLEIDGKNTDLLHAKDILLERQRQLVIAEEEIEVLR